MPLSQPDDDWNPDWGNRPSEWGQEEKAPTESHTNNDRVFAREEELQRQCSNLIRQNESLRAVRLPLLNTCYGLGALVGIATLGAVLNHAWYKDAERRNEKHEITIKKMQNETEEKTKKITDLESTLQQERELMEFLRKQMERRKQGM